MIELRLQMFGTGSLGAHKGGGGGGSKSTSKQAVSNNAPGSGRGGGGRRMDGGSGKREEEPQARTTQNRKSVESRGSSTRVSRPDYKTQVTAVADNEKYDVYTERYGKEKFRNTFTGKDILKAGLVYNKRIDAWQNKNGVKFRIRKTRSK